MRHQRNRVEDDNNELVISQPQPGTRSLPVVGLRGQALGWRGAGRGAVWFSGGLCR